MKQEEVESGHVAIDDGKSLKFARSIFFRQMLSVSKGSKAFICENFLVPCCAGIIITRDNTIRYAKYDFIAISLSKIVRPYDASSVGPTARISELGA